SFDFQWEIDWEIDWHGGTVTRTENRKHKDMHRGQPVCSLPRLIQLDSRSLSTGSFTNTVEHHRLMILWTKFDLLLASFFGKCIPWDHHRTLQTVERTRDFTI